MTANPSIDHIMDHSSKKAPSKLLLFTEGGRAAVGLGIYAATHRILKNVPKGDGHPVLVAPGFMASDRSTIILRKYLKDLGYTPKSWKMGINFGRPEYAFRMLARLEEIQERYSCKVSIIGWSLGGVFAREVARLRPDLVRQVITLGSPFGNILGQNNARWFYDFLHGPKGMDIASELLTDILIPPPVPTTAIYTKDDGVVNWSDCMEKEEGETTQNVQVLGSHFGLGHNPSVLYCIAERLRQEEDDWQRFDPNGVIKLMYPNLL